MTDAAIAELVAGGKVRDACQAVGRRGPATTGATAPARHRLGRYRFRTGTGPSRGR